MRLGSQAWLPGLAPRLASQAWLPGLAPRLGSQACLPGEQCNSARNHHVKHSAIRCWLSDAASLSRTAGVARILRAVHNTQETIIYLDLCVFTACSWTIRPKMNAFVFDSFSNTISKMLTHINKI